MDFLFTLLEKTVTFSGSGEAEAAAAAATQAANTASQTGAQGGAFGGIGMIIWLVAVFGLMYVFAIMPQKKREKELKAMQESMKVGDWVMTSNGFYGKIAEIYDKNVVIEFGLNKGIRIPVVKSEIYGNTEPNLTNKPQEDEKK